MRIKQKAVLGWFVLISLMLQSCSVLAQEMQSPTIYDLQASNDVQISAWIGSQSNNQGVTPFSVNQQVILNIEVATPRWFTGGTRIGSIEIPNVIVKQRNQLATNYTERKAGQTWSRQRWEITLYPQTSGEFVVPAVAVRVQVSAPSGENVMGTLYTDPVVFSAQLPSGLVSQEGNWFAATDVNVSQEWQTSSDQLHAGDAITRVVTIEARDSLSILLPDLLQTQSRADEDKSKYQSYPMPNQLDDSQVRGDYQSRRTEKAVYVLQNGGKVDFPQLSFQWWNAEKNRLETVVIAGRQYEVSHTLQSFVRAYATPLLLFGGLLLLVALSMFAIVRYFRQRPKPEWWQLHQLIKLREWGKVRTLVYRSLRSVSGRLEVSRFESSDNWQECSQRFLSGEQDSQVMRTMWRRIRARQKRILTLPRALPQLDKLEQSRRAHQRD
ncbi:hypothetical protein BIY22_16530 [Vibrio panuliri]|uniref:Protein BatD n=1 Tax=Vibrio panuliri TaxID=1381081 RepID=A0A1Q9HN09_9VIBR|nr:BatD family protein [Vibrio panuliri]OLQ92115.1 hypothetical protein BIY22_16530 [Vibrio panuliri]